MLLEEGRVSHIHLHKLPFLKKMLQHEPACFKIIVASMLSYSIYKLQKQLRDLPIIVQVIASH